MIALVALQSSLAVTPPNTFGTAAWQVASALALVGDKAKADAAATDQLNASLKILLERPVAAGEIADPGIEPLDLLRALHVNDAKSALGSNSDRHDNVLDGSMGEKLGVFLGHPALQGLPAVLEVPGTNGKGPDAEQVTKLRELHARWT